jgi:hypothetical protein
MSVDKYMANQKFVDFSGWTLPMNLENAVTTSLDWRCTSRLEYVQLFMTFRKGFGHGKVLKILVSAGQANVLVALMF